MDGTVIDLAIEKLQWLLEHPEVTWSGSGIYALSLAGSAAIAVASWCFLRKKKSPPSSEEHLRQPLPAQKTDNQFNSGGGEQTNLQGDHGIAKQINNNYNISPDVLDDVRKMAVTDSALASFFRILEEPQVPPGDLDSKLREFACQYQKLKLRLQVISSDDPEVKALKKQAEQAFENGRFSEVEEMLNQAKERDRAAVATLKASLTEQQTALKKRQLSEAASCAEQAKLQEMQYRYKKAAEYWQEAAAALPEGRKKERAYCLDNAGYDLYCVSEYTASMPLWTQALLLYKQIKDKMGESNTLNGISLICYHQGENEAALEYAKQSLLISFNIGYMKLIGTTLNTIATVYPDKDDYISALNLLKQSLLISIDNNDKDSEGAILNNIGLIYYAQDDHIAALKYLKRSLRVKRKINDKLGEGVTLVNISKIYSSKGCHSRALQYLESALVIQREIEDRANEATALNDIGLIYRKQGDDVAALKYLEESLSIHKKLGVKAGEAEGSWNIGWIYYEKGELAKAEPYISRAVELGTQLERPDLQDWRETLEKVRTKLRGR